MAPQILVIGAGISGLATAVALQRRGHDVTVIEERADTSSGAGISIWPNALAALDEIGLGDAVRDAGGRVTAGALRWRDGTWLRHPSPHRLGQARRRAGPPRGLDYAGRLSGHRRRRHPFGGGPSPQRRTGRPLRRLHGV